MKFGFKQAFIIILTSGVFACSGGGSSDGGTTTGNRTPVANAGADQSISTGAVVSLTAAGSSDADGDTLTYLWAINSKPTGSTAALSSTTATAPTFTADKDGSYILSLFVNDGTVNSVANLVSIEASTPNTAPVANAGANQSVRTGKVVTLNGSDSTDAEGNTLTYAWTVTDPDGAAVTLSSATAVSPTFTPNADGVYTATLVVNDGRDNSAAVSVTITAATSNAAPVANAGSNQNVKTATVVRLNGTDSSDADAGDELTFLWTLTPPTTSAAALNNAALASPKFTADIDGTYVATLVVNDSTVSSPAVSVTIIASSGNSAPTANAGANQNVLIDNSVSLDGSGSRDTDGDLISYSWTISNAPAGNTAALASATTQTPSFTPNVAGVYILQLIVNDGTLDSAPSTVSITVADGNSAPVANAGLDQVIQTGNIVTLNGAGSTDANSDGLIYTWAFVAKPTTSTAVLDDSTNVSPTFVADVQGSYVLSLVVSDTMENSVANNVEVLVADGQIVLTKKEGQFGNTFNEVEFPYTSSFSINLSIDGSPQPTFAAIETFKLKAQGGDLTIINIQAINDTNDIVPRFSNINVGEEFTLIDGEETEVALIIPLTGGVKIQVHFSFEIEETGQVFTSSYLVETN